MCLWSCVIQVRTASSFLLQQCTTPEKIPLQERPLLLSPSSCTQNFKGDVGTADNSSEQRCDPKKTPS